MRMGPLPHSPSRYHCRGPARSRRTRPTNCGRVPKRRTRKRRRSSEILGRDYLPIITSDALITAQASSPALSARSATASLVIDAVHYAPHFLTDVVSLDVDFLFCSAYKFYGPHVGILYAREGLLDQFEPDRLRTQNQRAPYRIETGTLNHAAIAGLKAAIQYLASIGEGKSLRSKLTSAFTIIHEHEFALAREMYEGLKKIRNVSIHGPSFDTALRAPTVSFTIDGKTAEEVCKKLAEKGICAWDGHFYAIRAIEALGLLAKGGVTRVGVLLYNTEDEIARFLKEIKKNPKTREIPVLVYSLSRDTALREACLNEGAAAFLPKPVDPEELYAAIQKATEERPRSYIRLTTCLSVIIGSGQVAGAESRNECVTAISEHGMYVSTSKPYPAGSQVSMTLLLGNASMKIDGRVLYSFDNSKSPLRTPGMGIKFSRINPGDQALIKAFIGKQITGGLRQAE